MTWDDCSFKVVYSTDPKYAPKFIVKGTNTYLECRNKVIYFRKFPTEILLEKRKCAQPRELVRNMHADSSFPPYISERCPVDCPLRHNTYSGASWIDWREG